VARGGVLQPAPVAHVAFMRCRQRSVRTAAGEDPAEERQDR